MFDATQRLADVDPELAAAIGAENQRQEDHIELIASENYTSPQVMAAQGSQLTNKYAEGYPGKRYYGGCEYVDIVEQLAIDRACELFDCDYANVQPHSGAQANAAVFLALVKPGETVLGMSLDAGGHLTHGAAPNFSGRQYNAVHYGLNEKTGRMDYDDIQRLADEHQPKMIIGGFSAYSRRVDWARLREIADSVGAWRPWRRRCGVGAIVRARRVGVSGASGTRVSCPWSASVAPPRGPSHLSLRGARGAFHCTRGRWRGRELRAPPSLDDACVCVP